MIASPTPATIARAAATLRDGGVVAFPTETVYGLGADATNATAVARIFEIKARPRFDPLIVHVADLAAWHSLVGGIPAAAHRLAQRFWPGPLTIVLPKSGAIPDLVTAGLPNVAVRMPDHSVALDLIRAAGRPLAAPSANPFGYISPTTAAHVEDLIGSHVALVLDGGPCRVGLESTVVSFADEGPTLLRPGGIALEDIEAVIGAVDVPATGARPLAPGQLPRHYAPRTPLVLIGSPRDVAPAARSRAALLACAPQPDVDGFAQVVILTADGDLRQAAVNLFAAMRTLDGAGHARIYAVAIDAHGLGRAIMDRLRRAAAM